MATQEEVVAELVRLVRTHLRQVEAMVALEALTILVVLLKLMRVAEGVDLFVLGLRRDQEVVVQPAMVPFMGHLVVPMQLQVRVVVEGATRTPLMV